MGSKSSYAQILKASSIMDGAAGINRLKPMNLSRVRVIANEVDQGQKLTIGSAAAGQMS